MKQLFPLLLLLPICLCGQNLFTRVTDAGNPVVSFINTNAQYKGASWIDLDHDNYPDLFVCQKFLFRNLGNGNFEQLPDVAGVTLGQAAAGASWGDIDNDGDLDCISASVVSGLHDNNGDQTFNLQNTLLSDFVSYRAWDCALADADNNGLLDLFFTHAEGFPPGSVSQPCKLYLQTGKDTFSLVTGYEFATEFKPFTIPIWTDFDLDGDADLLIGSGPGGSPGPDYCYRNMLKENGVFSLVRLTGFPFSQQQDGQVYNAIDYDNDGDMDICLSNYSGAKTRFYRNDNGNYVELNTPFTTTAGRLSNVWGDIDNDGDLDVLISVDGNPNILFYRNNAGAFAAASSLGAADNGICGIVLADYDNDGDLDIYTNGATTARALFNNISAAGMNQWAAFTLTGKQSNRSAIGTLLRIKANINGQAVWQIREITAHNSFQGQHDLRQHFGLGNAAVIDSVELRWPSGLVQKFSNLASNNFYKITEGQDVKVVATSNPESESIVFVLSPNPVSHSFTINCKEKLALLQLFDSTGKVTPISYETFGENITVQIRGNAVAGSYFLRAYFENGQTIIRPVSKL
jgi:enediyne biosynthesis protein E4